MAEYGEVWFSTTTTTVDRADPLALVDPEAFRQADILVTGDVVRVGFTADGEAVFYRIFGWDSDRRALIIRRITREEADDAG